MGELSSAGGSGAGQRGGDSGQRPRLTARRGNAVRDGNSPARISAGQRGNDIFHGRASLARGEQGGVVGRGRASRPGRTRLAAGEAAPGRVRRGWLRCRAPDLVRKLASPGGMLSGAQGVSGHVGDRAGDGEDPVAPGSA